MTTRARWSGPTNDAEHKRPALDRLDNVFRSGRRVLALHSVLGPDNGASTCDVAAVSAIAIAGDLGAVVDPTGDRRWRPDGPCRFRWANQPDIGLRIETISGPDGADLCLLQVRGGDPDDAEAVRAEVLEALVKPRGSAADIRSPSGSVHPSPRSATVDEATAALTGRPLVVLTGAGLSVGAGIMPFFGEHSLDTRLGLLDSAGRFEAEALERPCDMLAHLAEWHLSFLAAEPTAAHQALADLEARGHIASVLTTNIDRLHQVAGTRRVVESDRIHKVRPPRDAGVLVLGSANDPRGAIQRARMAGGTVVCVDARAPAWSRPEDLWVSGDPAAVAVDLAHRLGGVRTPLAALSSDAIAAGAGPSRGTVFAADHAILTVEQPDHRAPCWRALPSVADLVRGRATHPASRIHGPRHWLTVGWIGGRIATEVQGVDPLVVALFAMFHDCQRLHDGSDPTHGRRAAVEALALLAEEPWLSGAQLETLRHACALHSDGMVTDDPTVGACWDADRLDLWRVGATPDPRLLSLPESDLLRDWARFFTEVDRHDAAWDDWRPLIRVLSACTSEGRRPDAGA